MHKYLVRRLAMFIPSLLGLSILAFLLIRLIPGDFVVATLEQAASAEQVEAARKALGLDRPWHIQYVEWLAGVFRGDLGMSFNSQQPVAKEIMRRLPVTLELSLLALLSSIVLAVPAGVIATMKRGKWLDMAIRLLSFAGLSLPHFWLATMVLIYGAAKLNWVPPLIYVPMSESLSKNLGQFIVPAIILGIHLAARTLRMTRSSLIETLADDYVRTARAKGLSESRVMWRHALRNALVPVVTVIGTQFSYLLGGTVVIESIFGMPGIGRLMVDSITLRDYPQIQGNFLVVGALVLTVNLLVDLCYSLIDPRVSVAGSGVGSGSGSGGHGG